MIIDVPRNIPHNYTDFAIRMERTGEILREGIYYADDEKGYFDRFATDPPKWDPAVGDYVRERVYACIKIIPWPLNAPVTIAGYRTARD